MNRRFRGRIHAQGASIRSMGISMVQVALLESRFRGDALHSGAWCLRLAAQAAAIRACRITAQAGHNLALHELKQIRCTGRADSTRAYLHRARICPACAVILRASIHTHIHTYIYTYIHTYIHTYVHTYLHTYTHAHTRTHTHIHMHIHIHTS